MTKRILILDGNPVAEPVSFCHALSESYARGAREAGHEARIVHLPALEFSSDLAGGYHHRTELEPDLVRLREDLTWCEHFVLVHPVWWSNLPARLKGLFDRTFLPSFAFEYPPGKLLPVGLLKGRSARILYTQDAPDLYYRLVVGAPTRKMLGKGTLGFCGFSPVRFTAFGPVKGSRQERREAWLRQVEALGRKGQ